MISDFAISEIEAMQCDGLSPTPADIIRLNALGLAVERGPDAAALYTRRRAIRLTPSLTLCEPTIALAAFFAEAMSLPELVDTDAISMTLLRTWTLSLDEPPAWKPDAKHIAAAIEQFAAGPLKNVTLDQCRRANDYCLYGLSHTTGEYPESDSAEGDDKPVAQDFSMEVAIVSDAMTLGLGISLDDAKRLTPSRLAAIVQRAKDSRALDGEHAAGYFRERKNRALAAFNRTADAIRARLSAHRKEAQGGSQGQ